MAVRGFCWFLKGFLSYCQTIAKNVMCHGWVGTWAMGLRDVNYGEKMVCVLSNPASVYRCGTSNSSHP